MNLNLITSPPLPVRQAGVRGDLKVFVCLCETLGVLCGKNLSHRTTKVLKGHTKFHKEKINQSIAFWSAL